VRLAEFVAEHTELAHLPITALHTLAAPSTTDGPRNEVIALSKTGKKVKVKDVRSIVAKWKRKTGEPAAQKQIKSKKLGQGVEKSIPRITIRRRLRPIIRDQRPPANEEYFYARIRRRPGRLVIVQLQRTNPAHSN
jgi:hypothetical protein